MADERRFTGADFTSDNSEPGRIHHAEFKHGECQSVDVAPIDQIGVWQD
jgi:hypothetical protein